MGICGILYGKATERSPIGSRSGRREALQPPAPLRTVRDSFPSYSSSLYEGIAPATPGTITRWIFRGMFAVFFRRRVSK